MVIGIIILIVLLVIIFNSYSKFNAQLIAEQSRLNRFENSRVLSIDFKARYDYGVCCMKMQQYVDAMQIFEGLFEDARYIDEFPEQLKIRVRKNIEFCLKPLPWSPGRIENKTGDYLHYFLVQRFGNQRYN